MRKLLGIVLGGALLSGCLVGRHGHVSLVPPPGVLIAGAIAAAAIQEGNVWVEGHWDWAGGRWIWSEGFWIPARPGFIWIQGSWQHGHHDYHWRPGYWRRR